MPRFVSAPGRFAWTPVALALACVTGAAAQTVGAEEGTEPLKLKGSPSLRDDMSEPQRKERPVFLSGDTMTGRTDLETTAQGHAELRHADTVIQADRLTYFQPEDKAQASGSVRLNRAGNVYEGPLLELQVDSFEGFFSQPDYYFLRNDGHGSAERLDFMDDKHSTARNASFTTCTRRPGPSWLPDWVLNAGSVKFDYEEDTGEAQDAVLRFKNVPILVLPDMSFPLSDKRKSGWLPPTFSVDSLDGIDLIVPYYRNIAPNRDWTLYPELMSRRGFNVGSDFRYLERDYRGNVRVDYMPSDSLRGRTRWGLSQSHTGAIDTGLPGVAPLNLSLSLNRVSDDNYWKDFPRATASLTQRLLANNGTLSWSSGFFSTSVSAFKYQTLQDTSSPITPPYDRLPQWTARYARSNVAGFDYSLSGEVTRFSADSALTLQTNGTRAYGLAQISHPWIAPGWFVTPKLQLHSTRYAFDTALTNQANSASRTVPTFSLDSGVVLERNASYFGRAFTQTLEPRAFYVYTPFRDQSLLPNYDSGANDFNFATVFTENNFGGNDRIADSNLVTLGATTRLLDPDSGAEAARFTMAQRLLFKPQHVTLPGGTPEKAGLSDILLGAGINWTPRWALNSTLQYSPSNGRSERASVSTRYNPSSYRALSLGYSYQAGASRQIDIGWQWPLDDLWRRAPDAVRPPGQGLGEGRWYSVGRFNYSMFDHQLIDSIVGFEYDAGCWIARTVLDRLQLAGQAANTRVMLQLEFVGFSRLGSNPLQVLKGSIPRYQYLREQTTTPSRFSNYD